MNHSENCQGHWEVVTIYGDGYQGLHHYERRCSECGLFEEVDEGTVVASW